MDGSAQSPRVAARAEWNRVHAESWLRVSLANALPEQNQRAEAALREFFDVCGVSAINAAFAYQSMEAWDDSGFAAGSEPSAEADAAMSAWDRAHAVAWTAGMGTLPFVPGRVKLELQYDEAAYNAAYEAMWPTPDWAQEFLRAAAGGSTIARFDSAPAPQGPSASAGPVSPRERQR